MSYSMRFLFLFPFSFLRVCQIIDVNLATSWWDADLNRVQRETDDDAPPPDFCFLKSILGFSCFSPPSVPSIDHNYIFAFSDFFFAWKNQPPLLTPLMEMEDWRSHTTRKKKSEDDHMEWKPRVQMQCMKGMYIPGSTIYSSIHSSTVTSESVRGWAAYSCRAEGETVSWLAMFYYGLSKDGVKRAVNERIPRRFGRVPSLMDGVVVPVNRGMRLEVNLLVMCDRTRQIVKIWRWWWYNILGSQRKNSNGRTERLLS